MTKILKIVLFSGLTIKSLSRGREYATVDRTLGQVNSIKKIRI
jgi:hypothetical protein